VQKFLFSFASSPFAVDNNGAMERRFIAFLFLICLLIPPSVSAQDSNAELDARRRQAEIIRQQEEARRAEETRRMFDWLTNRPAPPPSFGNRPRSAPERDKFYETVPLFREATGRYRDAIGSEPDLRAYVKAIDKLIGPLRDYFETMKFKREPLDFSEYQDISPKDLMWETLIVTERTDNNLQLTRRLVQQSEREGVINIKVLEFFGNIQDDLSRLKWLISKVVEAGPLASDKN
jgi:hypothetical protein